MFKIKEMYNKITSVIIIILLVSTLVTSGPYSMLPASASLDTSDSGMQFHAVALPPVSNTIGSIHKNTHVVISPLMHKTPHVSSLLSKNSLSKLASNVGAVSGNDGYCTPGTLGTCGNLTYNGGNVMHNARLLIVFWVGGSFSNCSTSHYFENATNDPLASATNDCSYMNLQVRLLKDICSDPFMKIASQYHDTVGGAGPCFIATPPAGKFNPLVDTTAFPHATLIDTDIQNEAQKMATYMGVTFDGNTQVYVFTPYNKPSCIDSTPSDGCFGVQYCAYHGWTSPTFLYASMPDAAAAGSGCGVVSPSPNSDPVADIETSPLSHELMESITDPSGGGWYFFDGTGEIGDECLSDYGTINADGSNIYLGTHGNPYKIQKEWSNTNGGCTLSEQSLPASPSAPPTAISASAISGSSIRLTWTASSGATSYNVFRSTSPSGASGVLAGSPTASPFNDTGLSATTTYYYNLTASNTGGTSPISRTIVSATTLGGPSAPTGVTATLTSPTSIKITWTASTNATSYNIYRFKSSSSILVGSTSALQFVNTGLINSIHLYYYKVVAVNSNGQSALSNPSALIPRQ